MKKILFALLAVAALFSGCSNDDIEIIGNNEVTLKVNSESVFREFGTYQSVKEQILSSGGYVVGIYTFVYDKQEKLVAADSVYSNTFNQAEQHFMLNEGEYTAVTLEMLVEKDEGYTSDTWCIVGQQTLSTLELRQKDREAYWYEAVGVASSQLSVGEDAVERQVTPKGVGCVIDVSALNFDKTGSYDMYQITTKDKPLGRYLSPKNTGSARFNWGSYSASNTEYIRNYKGRQPRLNEEERMTIYFLEEGTITYNVVPAVYANFGSWNAYPNKSFTALDGHHYYGGVVYCGNSASREWDVNMFDNAADFAKWANDLLAGYDDSGEGDTPQTPSLILPSVNWGASAATVKSEEEAAGMSFVSEDYDSESAEYFHVFTNEDKSVQHGFWFNSQRKDLNYSIALYLNSSLQQVLDELKKVYTYQGKDSDGDDRLADSKTQVAVIDEDGDVYVHFFPNTSNAPSRAARHELQKQFRQSLLKK